MALCEESPEEISGHISFSDELEERDPLVIAAILKAAAEIYLEGLAGESGRSG